MNNPFISSNIIGHSQDKENVLKRTPGVLNVRRVKGRPGKTIVIDDRTIAQIKVRERERAKNL